MGKKHTFSSKQVVNDLGKALSQGLNIPVYTIDEDMVEQIFSILIQEPILNTHYTKAELYSEISDFLSMYTVAPPRSKKDIEDRINKFTTSLKKEKTYEATVIIPSLRDYPSGTKIGALEIVDPVADDKELAEYVKHEEKTKRTYADLGTYAKISFKSYTTVGVGELLGKELELPLSILSLVAHYDFDPRDCIGIIRSKDLSRISFISPEHETRGWTRYNEEGGKYLSILSQISATGRSNPLEKKILQSVQIFGLSRLTRKNEIRFLLLTSALESLLLTEGDRDYLSKKLAEKTAFLLENTFEKRKQLYQTMKDVYRKRSRLVHSGKMQITASDVYLLEDIYRLLAMKILELSLEYPKMEQKQKPGENEGIEDLINKMKFS